MPTWLAISGGVVALIVAIGTLWSKVLKPLALAIAEIERAVPLIKQLVRMYGEDMSLLTVLNEIAAQFRTNSGSSLRDLANRLEKAALESKQALEMVEIQIESARQLAERDREQLQALLIGMDRQREKLEKLMQTGEKAEATARRVAFDLEAAGERADRAKGGYGAAADAAVKTKTKAKPRKKK